MITAAVFFGGAVGWLFGYVYGKKHPQAWFDK